MMIKPISLFVTFILISTTAQANAGSSLDFIYDYWWVLVMVPAIMLLKNIFNKMDDSNEDK